MEGHGGLPVAGGCLGYPIGLGHQCCYNVTLIVYGPYLTSTVVCHCHTAALFVMGGRLIHLNRLGRRHCPRTALFVLGVHLSNLNGVGRLIRLNEFGRLYCRVVVVFVFHLTCLKDSDHRHCHTTC